MGSRKAFLSRNIGDAVITDPQHDDLLTFNAVSGIWVNEPPAIAFSDLFLIDEESDIDGYFKLLASPPEGAEVEDQVNVATASGLMLIEAFATDDAVNTTLLRGGSWHFVTWAKADSVVGVTDVVVKIYTRTVGDSETLLATVIHSNLGTDLEEFESDVFIPDTVVNKTDRLVAKYYAQTTSVPNRVVTMTHDGVEHYTHLHLPFGIGSGGGEGGGHTIQDEGVPLTQRTNLNFEGSAITVVDDSGNDATKVIVSSTLASGILSQEVYETLTAQVVSGISHFSLSDEIVDDSLRVYYNGIRQQSNYFAVDSDNEGFTTAFVVDGDDEIFVDYEVTTSGIGIIEAYFTSLLDTPASFVTYSGAFVLVNPTEDALEFSHMVDYIDFNTDWQDGVTEGRLAWDEGDKTLELGMPGGEVKLQIGQEIHIRAKNTSGGNITNGQAVYVSGGEGANPTVSLAQADERGRAAIALATEDVDNGQFGYFTFVGLVRDVDTSQFSAAGDLCWLADTPGALQTYPASGDSRHNVIGMVIRKHADEGVIYVTSFIFNYVDELSGVTILNPIADDVLTYYAPSGIWINKQGGGGASTFLDLTDVPDDYSGEGEKFVKVTAEEDGLEFAAGGGGASAFLDLTDTPADYSGEARKHPIVNDAEDALEFVTISGGAWAFEPSTESLGIDQDRGTGGSFAYQAQLVWISRPILLASVLWDIRISDNYTMTVRSADDTILATVVVASVGAASEDEEFALTSDLLLEPGFYHFRMTPDSPRQWYDKNGNDDYYFNSFAIMLELDYGGTTYDAYRSPLKLKFYDSYTIQGKGIILSDTDANEPPAGTEGDLFMPTDGFYLKRDTGVVWSGWGPLFPMVEPVLGDFSWVNQGTATADDTYGGIYLKALAAGGDSHKILKKDALTPPYTLTVALIPQLFGYNYNQCGIGWRQSSDGKLVTMTIPGYTKGLVVNKWTNETTYNGTYGTILLDNLLQPMIWLRVEDDGANRICSISSNGVFFTAVHSVGRTDFLTADEVFVYVDSNNVTWDAGALVLSWLLE